MRPIIAALAFTLILASPAAAQTVCAVGVPDEVLGKVLEHNGQTAVLQLQLATGPDTATMPAVMTMDPDGAWSIFYLAPSGNLCFLAIGIGANPMIGGQPVKFPSAILPGENG